MPRTMSTARIVPDDRTSPPSEPDCEVVMAVREEPVVPNVSPTLRLVLVSVVLASAGLSLARIELMRLVLHQTFP